MTFDDLLRSRRSIRSFLPDEVPEDVLRAMVRSSTTAPSPSNSRPVRFLRLAGRERRDALRKAMEAGFERLLIKAESSERPKKMKNIVKYYWRHSVFMFDAPALLAVGVTEGQGRLSMAVEGTAQDGSGMDGGNLRERSGLDITMGLSLSAFILKGEELGVGTCILTAPLAFAENCEAVLSIAGIRIGCFVAAGYPAEKPPAASESRVDDLYREI